MYNLTNFPVILRTAQSPAIGFRETKSHLEIILGKEGSKTHRHALYEIAKQYSAAGDESKRDWYNTLLTASLEKVKQIVLRSYF